ncbi:carbohydrate esterase family 1 protein, partial [Hydnomerulius pinastri MD-312]
IWEKIKQQANVFAISQTPDANTTNDSLPGYSWAVFDLSVGAILARSVGLTVPVCEGDVLSWFGCSSLEHPT